jgi:hypothetical protein
VITAVRNHGLSVQCSNKSRMEYDLNRNQLRQLGSMADAANRSRAVWLFGRWPKSDPRRFVRTNLPFKSGRHLLSGFLGRHVIRRIAMNSALIICYESIAAGDRSAVGGAMKKCANLTLCPTVSGIARFSAPGAALLWCDISGLSECSCVVRVRLLNVYVLRIGNAVVAACRERWARQRSLSAGCSDSLGIFL